MHTSQQDFHIFLRQQRLRQQTSAEIGYWTYKQELLPPEGPYNVNVKKGQNSIDLMNKFRKEKWENNGVIPPRSKTPYGGPTGTSIYSSSYKDPNSISGARHSARSTSGRTNKKSINTSTIDNKIQYKDYLGKQIPQMKKLRKTSTPNLPQTSLHPFIASQGVKAPENWKIYRNSQSGDHELNIWKTKPADSDNEVWVPIPKRKSSTAAKNGLFCANPSTGLHDNYEQKESTRSNISRKGVSFTKKLKEKYTPPEISHLLPPAQPNALDITIGEEKLQYEPSMGTIGLIKIKPYPQTEAKCQETLQEYKLSGNNILKDIEIQEDDKIFDFDSNDQNSRSILDLDKNTVEIEPNLDREVHRSTLKAYKNYKDSKYSKKKKLDELKAKSIEKLGKCLKIPKLHGEYDDYQNGSTFKSARYDRLITEEGKPGTYGFDNSPHDWVNNIVDTANGDLRSKDWSHNLRGMRW